MAIAIYNMVGHVFKLILEALLVDPKTSLAYIVVVCVGVLPNWMQQSAGLKYRTKLGDAKALLLPANTKHLKSNIDLEAC